VNFLDVLANISSSTIATMQRRIAALAPSLQYSIVPPGYGPEYDPEYVANREKKKRGKTRQRGSHSEVCTALPYRECLYLIYVIACINKECLHHFFFLLITLWQSSVSFRGNVWRPPQRDAVDVMIDRMLDPLTIEPLGGFTPKEWQALQVAQQDVNILTPSYTGYLDVASAAKAEKRLLPAAHISTVR